MDKRLDVWTGQTCVWMCGQVCGWVRPVSECVNRCVDGSDLRLDVWTGVWTGLDVWTGQTCVCAVFLPHNGERGHVQSHSGAWLQLRLVQLEDSYFK